MPDRWKITLLSGWFKPKTEAAPPVIQVGTDIWPVRIVRHARSRRYRLVFDAVRAELRLTMPQRGQADKALKWAAQQQDWIAGQTAKAERPVVAAPDTCFPYLGDMLTIKWDVTAPRTPVLDDGCLYMGGGVENVGARTQRWLRTKALAVMTEESQILATQAGLPLRRVGIGDPRSRWGSCTAQGDIRYSWRLIMAPSHVRRATVAHEVAHLRHMDHSPAFHAFVDQLYDGDVASSRQWLRAHGRDLHRYRFDEK